MSDVKNKCITFGEHYQEITWSELKGLRDSSSLYPGVSYRITDYKCTTTDTDSSAAGHQFDIVVKAVADDTLSEKCHACRHTGDIYFPVSTNFDAWELWYCLDNDSSRFDWADETSGRGVIYRMIDEFGNDCPYDFKNIMFLREYSWFNGDQALKWKSSALYSMQVDGNMYFYTFSFVYANASVTDFTLLGEYEYGGSVMTGGCWYNVIEPYLKSESIGNGTKTYYKLPGNIFVQSEYNIWDNAIVALCKNNTVKSGAYGNNLGHEVFENVIDGGSYGNFICNSCQCNHIGKNCHDIFIGDSGQYNEFGDSCRVITIEKNSMRNEFGPNCNTITADTWLQCNHFDGYNNTIIFGSNNTYNRFMFYTNQINLSDSCSSNTFGLSCSKNTLGSSCSFNTIGDGSQNCALGDNCKYNTFGKNCYMCSMGNYCNYNIFGDYCQNVMFGSQVAGDLNYYENNCVEGGCSYIRIYGKTTPTSSKKLQNVTVHRGVKGTGATWVNISVTTGIPYNYEYARNSAGTGIEYAGLQEL